MRKLLIACGLLLAGCGGEPSSAENFQGEQRAVAAVVEEIQTAGERRDAELMCRELVAQALRDRLGEAGSSCDKEMEKAIDDADGFDISVEKVTVSGTTADVEVKGDVGGKERTTTLEMVKEDGRWRAASFGSVP